MGQAPSIAASGVKEIVLTGVNTGDFGRQHGQDFLHLIQVLASRFQGIPDVHYGDTRHFVAGDRGVSEWTLTGTTVAGVPVHVRGCDLWEFRGGQVIRKDSYWKIVER